jgi:hypothetical protein
MVIVGVDTHGCVHAAVIGGQGRLLRDYVLEHLGDPQGVLIDEDTVPIEP